MDWNEIRLQKVEDEKEVEAGLALLLPVTGWVSKHGNLDGYQDYH